ncbi:MAG: sensor histidine kinase [Blautia sp.]|nr:sensor histidine kinase [Blautia sp.]
MHIPRSISRRFHNQNIAGRIIIVISALMIVTVLGFIASLFVAYRSNLAREQRLSIEKDMTMTMEKLDMFFDMVESDSVSVLVSEDCQKLLASSSPIFENDILLRHQQYKILRDLINGYIGQKGIYHTIAFYDLYGNCYVSESLEKDDSNFRAQQKRASDFLSSSQVSLVTGLHLSPWRKQGSGYYESCISYFHKINGRDNGRLIGMIELEIPVSSLVNLYRTVMSDTVRIEFSSGQMIIVSPDGSRLYQSLAQEDWYDADALSSLSPGTLYMQENRSAWRFCKVYPDQNWLMISTVQKAGYWASLRNYVIALLFLSVCLLLGAIILIRYLVNSITSPIRSMTQTVVRIGQGDSESRISTGEGGEIGILETEINRMLDRIQTLMDENVQKEQLKREAEMSMLQLQMTPHFFYNILESIVGLIYMDEKKTAVQAIQHLSGFYRGVLNHGKEIISIGQELETARNYLEIMMICHPGLFTYQITCSESARSCAVCKLSLQPILENAVHHGFQDMESGGLIDVTVTEQEEQIFIDVKDNGKGMDDESRKRVLKEENSGFRMESFGLRNTDDRFKLYFGPDYGVRILRADQGTWIRINLPRECQQIMNSPADPVPAQVEKSDTARE